MTDTLITDAAPTSEGTQTQTATTQPVADVTTQQTAVTDTALTGDVKTEDSVAPLGAPEKYEFTLPEGFAKGELMGELESVAKELNLPQAEAQKLVDLGIKQRSEFVKQQQDSVATMQEAWITSTKADKEFGGDKLDQNMAVAKKALDAFGTPELRTLLIESGLGNHPEIIRAFYRAGQKISDDTHVSAGTGVTAKSASAADRLYANQNSK